MSRVLVVDALNQPLMPCHSARARQLLDAGRAVVARRFPFTIRLGERVGGAVQPVTLKIDPGSRTTGLALVGTFARGAVVLWAAELDHRGLQIRAALTRRRAVRRSRRSRKTRYRAARFRNRRRPARWLPPSLMSRVGNVLTWVRRLRRACPVSHLALEAVRFDTQALQNPEISGVEYQQGERAGYEVKEYLLIKWGHRCAYCDATDRPLQIDHIVPRSRGGSNRVWNLTLACGDCNQDKDNQEVRAYLAHDPARLARLLAQARAPLADAAAVNSTRAALHAQVQGLGLPIEVGTGGRTKFNRTQQGYPKAHWIDAACVGLSGAAVHLNPTMHVLRIRATGRGSRQMCGVDRYGFPRTASKRAKRVQGFQTGDMVAALVPTGRKAGRYVGRVAVRASGSFNLQTTRGMVQGISYRHCHLLHQADGYAYD